MLRRLFVKLINCKWINADNREHLTVERLALGNLGLQFSEIWGWDMGVWSKAGARKGGSSPWSKVPLPSFLPSQTACSRFPPTESIWMCAFSFFLLGDTFFSSQSLVEISDLH